MFGFLHEVQGRKLLTNLKQVLKENYLIIISDNLLHFKIKVLKRELKSVFQNNYTFRIKKFIKDYKFLYSLNLIMIKIIKHKGRTDKFFIITTNYSRDK